MALPEFLPYNYFVYINNISTVKTSSTVQEISNHAMAVTDIDITPQHIKQKPRKLYIFSKANRDKIFDDIDQLSREIISFPASSTIKDLWDIF